MIGSAFMFISHTLFHVCLSNSFSVTTLDDGVLAQEFPLSYKQCVDECKERLKCVSAKYFRNYKLCKLYSEHQERSVEFVVYSKPGILLQEHADRYAACNAEKWDSLSTCVPVSCPNPPDVYGADILGNEYKIGSAIMYQCRSIEDSQTSSCTPEGIWTKVTLICNCKASAPFDIKVVDSNETHIFTEKHCESGTVVIQNYQTCDLPSGVWLVSASCCETGPKQWFTIFNYIEGTGTGSLSAWKSWSLSSSLNIIRSALIDDWQALAITRVKVEVFKDNIMEAYMIFNGCDSDKMNWFSRERLMSSSWEDLQYGSELDELSITGKNEGFRRFFVSKSNGLSESCMMDTGWFVSLGNYYSCSVTRERFPSIKILYSPHTTATKFYEMSYADEFVVSIQKEH